MRRTAVGEHGQQRQRSTADAQQRTLEPLRREKQIQSHGRRDVAQFQVCDKDDPEVDRMDAKQGTE